MTVYYIRHDEYDDRAKVIHGLRNIYNLQTYQLTAVIVEDEGLEDVLGPIFGSLAEHIEKPALHVFNPDVELPCYPEGTSVWMVEPESGSTLTETGTDQLASKFTPTLPSPSSGEGEPLTQLVPVKRKRGEVPKELCPECGRTAPMTKKGYCKLCAMGKAREAKKAVAPSPYPLPAATLMERENEKSAAPVVREREAQGVEIIFETTPVEMRQIRSRGAIRGKRLG